MPSEHLTIIKTVDRPKESITKLLVTPLTFQNEVTTAVSLKKCLLQMKYFEFYNNPLTSFISINVSLCIALNYRPLKELYQFLIILPTFESTSTCFSFQNTASFPILKLPRANLRNLFRILCRFVP